jgi:PAS domain-containing protein
MKASVESIYPDVLRVGVGKLRAEGLHLGDVQTLLAALENYHLELKQQEGPEAILRVIEQYVGGLQLFDYFGIYLVQPEDLSFGLALCAPEERRADLEQWVQAEIRARRFAWALRKDGPACCLAADPPPPRAVMFHTLGAAAYRIGMFCGVLRSERIVRQEINLSLLSLLLRSGSDALATARHMADLKRAILVANRDLQRALSENEVLARIPVESPSPVLRLNRHGQLLYANAAASNLLEPMGLGVGDLLEGAWLEVARAAFRAGQRQEFEASFGPRTYVFEAVAILGEGYANFYGTDISARKRAEAEREQLIRELREALAKVRTLHGLLPICAWCKNIRDDHGYWKQLEIYIESHADVSFSHGICPQCMEKFQSL